MKYYSPYSRQHNGFTAKMRSKQALFRSKARQVLENFTEHDPKRRLIAMIIIASVVIVLFILRLFFLQILHGADYEKQAYEQQYGKIIIPAKRGEILTENPKTHDLAKLATNTTLDLIYIDPKEVPDKRKIANELAPILFDEQDFISCKEDYRQCPSGGVQFDQEQILLDENSVPTKETGVEKIKDTRTKEQLIQAYSEDIFKKISKTEVDYSPLQYGASDEVMKKIDAMAISGIIIVRNKNLIYADPTHIDQAKIKAYVKMLAPILKQEESSLMNLLTRRGIRYIPLKRQLSPEASEAIWDLKKKSYEFYKKDTKKNPHFYKGVVLVPEHWRYYPEKELASPVVGYVDHEGIGRYGIEEKFDEFLRGKQGVMLSRTDVNGAELVIDTDQMVQAEDGGSIILTIDRVIQQKVESVLKAGVEKFHADNGTVVIMDPNSGEVLAMANYPNFDPNNFGSVYELVPTEEKDWEDSRKIYFTQPFFIKNEKGEFEQKNYSYLQEEKNAIEKAKQQLLSGVVEKDENGNEKAVEIPKPKTKYVYKNRFGLGAYLDRAVMSTYEPGSVFKPLAMSIALDAKEVTPSTTYNETGPLEIDTGTGQKQYIHTALNVYRGIQTMTNALEYSSNIGMAFMAKKLGKSLFYSYIKDFGFGDYTYIDLVGEQKGGIEFWKKWNEAKLYTTSFGQGIAVTPIQITSAWCALANGGILMQAKIVKAFIDKDGNRKDVEDKIIRRVISKSASQQITGMLLSSATNGAAKAGRVKGYKLAGKTGTAQVACADSHRCRMGYYERGDGTTITSYGGYAPIKNPKFVMLVKFERPRLGPNTWGENTAAPVFKEISEFLFQYFDIPPDDL